jgi:hypothetical protein
MSKLTRFIELSFSKDDYCDICLKFGAEKWEVKGTKFIRFFYIYEDELRVCNQCRWTDPKDKEDEAENNQWIERG